jgi:hypothetical protein
VKEELGRLDNRLGHLESEVSASSAENELTSMTIDTVGWADPSTAEMFGSKTALVCHVVEWRGFGKMLRFTRMADPNFVLEAGGHAPIEAHVGTGGICGSDGSGRSVVLDLSWPPDPGVRYSVRARNESKYRWSRTGEPGRRRAQLERLRRGARPTPSRRLLQTARASSSA